METMENPYDGSNGTVSDGSLLNFQNQGFMFSLKKCDPNTSEFQFF